MHKTLYIKGFNRLFGRAKKSAARTLKLKHRVCMHKTLFKGFNRLFGRAKKSAARTLKERFDEIRGRAPGQLHSLFSEAVEAEKSPVPTAAASGSFRPM